jgi:two-component system sensor histidine kinase EvgS
LLIGLVWAGLVSAAEDPQVKLTPQETEWIAAHPVIEVGVFAGNHYPLEAWVAGAPEGIGVDYAKLLASRVGMRVQFRPFTDWEAVSLGEMPASLDLLVGQSHGFTSHFDYLNPYVQTQFVLVARRGDLKIRSEADLTHARIAVERISIGYTRIVKSHFPDATLVFSDAGEQALDMVAQGFADAYIGVSARTRWLLSERELDDLSTLATLPDLGPVQPSLAVPGDRPLLAALLRKAADSVSDDEMSNLRSRWGYDADLNTPIPLGHGLSDEDRQWLSGLGTIRVGYETDRYPYSFMDRNGALNGLAADYLAVIQKKLDLRVELVPARDLDELQRRVAANEVDLVAAAMPADFDPAAMTFTRPYERFPEVIVTRVKGQAIAGPEDLRGKKVSVREEAGLIAGLKLLLPHSTLVPVVSNEAGLNMVEKGQVAAYIGTLPAIDALIRDRYAASLRVVAPAGLDQDISFGVSRSKLPLARLIDQTLSGMKASERQAMRGRWLRADYSYGAPWRWVLVGLLISATIFAIIGLACKRMKDAEARARASEQRLVDTNENLPGVVIRLLIDAQNRRTYEYVSGPTLGMFGMSREDILAGLSRPFDAAIEEDREIVRDAAERYLQLKHAEMIEFRTCVRGDIRWIRAVGGEPKPTGQGSHFWSLYCADVTVEKEQERTLKEAKATAEAAVAAKGAFLAMMSHEIRTPMAGVLGLVELLSKTPLNNEQSNMLGMVQDSSVALLQILDDILDFSRIEAERLELEPDAFDLRLLADSAVGTFAARARQKDLKLYLVQDWRLASEYRGDANRLRQIVNNLLSNALKFTSQGHVVLRVELLSESVGGQQLRFSVTDTGMGISADQLNRLFQPFMQAETSTARRFGGTGLGLAICRRLALLMGGEVKLTSAPGQGTCASFEVTLPVLQTGGVIAGIDQKRALICTRDPMLERELANAFSAMGCSVMEIDADDVTEFTADDADIYIADAALIEQGVGVMGMPTIHVLADTDPRGFYEESDRMMLCGSPLLWRSTVDACRITLGLSARVSQQAFSTAPGARAIHVLVAEDHPINRAVIERQLDLLGYIHTVVEDGQQAWDALTHSPFDLLITDCHMPVLDGYALAQRIRRWEEETGAHLPIIALSASALPEEVDRCHRAGMDDFLAKPVQLEELQKKITAFANDIIREQPVGKSTHGDRLAYLSDVFGSPDQLKILLEGLLDEGDTDVVKLDAAIAQGDAETQRNLLHRLIGALRLIDPGVVEGAHGDSMSDRRDAVVEQLARIREMVEELRENA